jgi:hypothetical protein
MTTMYGGGEWNGLLESHFANCEQIYSYPDHSRGRTLRIFMLPGKRTDLVGVSDGSESWITNPSCVAGGKVIPLVAARTRVKLQL